MADTNTIRSNVQDAASQAGQAVQQGATTVAEKAQELASNAGKRVEEATAALGERVQNMAGTIREHGPREGRLGSATETVAGSLDSAGRYLREEGLAGMADDLTEIIRRNPIPAICIGVGFGFLLAQLMRR
jgi:ElaB/YqjD/DUF883 family membrane-anchored ribosome-binding protein